MPVVAGAGDRRDRTVETHEYDATGRRRKTLYVDTAAQRSAVHYSWGVEDIDAFFAAPAARGESWARAGRAARARSRAVWERHNLVRWSTKRFEIDINPVDLLNPAAYDNVTPRIVRMRDSRLRWAPRTSAQPPLPLGELLRAIQARGSRPAAAWMRRRASDHGIVVAVPASTRSSRVRISADHAASASASTSLSRL